MILIEHKIGVREVIHHTECLNVALCHVTLFLRVLCPGNTFLSYLLNLVNNVMSHTGNGV